MKTKPNQIDLSAFQEYLRQMRHTEESIKSYTYQLQRYLSKHPDAGIYTYSDMIKVLDELTTEQSNAHYRITILASYKKYYDYLIDAGMRNDHPCKSIYIKKKRNKNIIHGDLFSSEELELLLDRKERYEILKWKNKAIISLLIYQGLSSGEIARMKLSHVHLDKGRIFVKQSKDLARRHLDLQPNQYHVFDRYIRESRKKLIKEDTDLLFIGMRGHAITVGEVSYLVEQFKLLFPTRTLNPKKIRQSVIANWLNEQKLSLEEVQLMAGHRWISSTERYKSTSIEEKRSMIAKFHPLG